VQDQPTDLPDEQAPDQDLRAARVQIRQVGSILRQTLADDVQLAGPSEDADR
jgi:hypothetical protein